ncbi:hypothetical protein IFM89_031582 [Coptis chinensis]|uniref:Uncharacterized protein n=1 Tax=Coptis chinensis TaxID=261450 RepID=A0A835LP23_9MAGN|nr:hypothetical protein IFM89_031582 [Coptis chinensis]
MHLKILIAVQLWIYVLYGIEILIEKAKVVGALAKVEKEMDAAKVIVWWWCWHVVFDSDEVMHRDAHTKIVITLDIYGVKNIFGIPFSYRGFYDKSLSEIPVRAASFPNLYVR